MADRIINYARIAKKPDKAMTPQDNQDVQDFYDPSKNAQAGSTVHIPTAMGGDSNIWYRPGDILPPQAVQNAPAQRLKNAIRGVR